MSQKEKVPPSQGAFIIYDQDPLKCRDPPILLDTWNMVILPKKSGEILFCPLPPLRQPQLIQGTSLAAKAARAARLAAGAAGAAKVAGAAKADRAARATGAARPARAPGTNLTFAPQQKSKVILFFKVLAPIST